MMFKVINISIVIRYEIISVGISHTQTQVNSFVCVVYDTKARAYICRVEKLFLNLMSPFDNLRKCCS